MNLEKLLEASAALKRTCEEIAENGYPQPSHTIHGVPRELFDSIPAISRVDDDDDPVWEKRYKGVLYTCYEAPMVKL